MIMIIMIIVIIIIIIIIIIIVIMIIIIIVVMNDSCIVCRYLCRSRGHRRRKRSHLVYRQIPLESSLRNI
jgi:hypothetical protein